MKHLAAGYFYVRELVLYLIFCAVMIVIIEQVKSMEPKAVKPPSKPPWEGLKRTNKPTEEWVEVVGSLHWYAHVAPALQHKLYSDKFFLGQIVKVRIKPGTYTVQHLPESLTEEPSCLFWLGAEDEWQIVDTFADWQQAVNNLPSLESVDSLQRSET